MSAGFEKADTSSETDGTLAGADLQTALFDAVCDSLSAAFIIYDKNDHLIFASRQILEFFPLPSEMLKPGIRLRDFLGAIYDTGVRQQYIRQSGSLSREDWLSQKIASHWRERFESVERHGADSWVRFVKRRLPGGYGVTVVSDISEDKKREEQWRSDMERVQLTEDILDNLPFPLFVKDRNLTYVAVNLAFCEKYQRSADEVLGRKSGDLFSPEIAKRFEESDRHVLETGEMSISRQRQISRDGIERDIVSRKHRIGKPGRYFLVSTMQDLPRDGADLEEFDRASAITASTNQSYRRAYVPVPSAVERREPAAMEAIVPENFSGRKILVVTADLAAETAALRTLTKYGFESCSVRGEDEEERFLEIATSSGISLDLLIIDNQMGMRCLELAEQYGIPALVMDGFQIANELTFQIARHFNRNSRNNGSGADADWEISTSDDTAGLQVLVAEDNDINQIVFSQILEGLGYRHMIAVTGDEVVRLWAEHRPGVVLMDISLPGFNGFEAARLIRQMEEAGRAARTPIIGVLTQAFERDRAECAKSGMDDVIMKPVSPDMLETIFQKYLTEGAAPVRASG
ncbi:MULTISPECIES: response regulator [Rhizobium]|uniref:response regulator n=1 Tax=Rhizobium TaxID=379 RepID=UPI0007EBF8F3|nr:MULTISPECIES: response regulator [Rhizobium]ANK90385.1 response regulator protein [Rhizobium sp. N6212]ANK96413.1 response regulator protein [Rhizobium sp. N621]ANL02457.1 response regulator protein [Rhizobium esperanzae]ANL08585.1 response regulator protein [Rhizobium sp. N1341]ANL20633.1 response regulator protein [Rhizobium sp. N113]